MNQREILEDDSQTAALPDLPLDSEHAEQTRAGSGVVSPLGPPATSEEKKLDSFLAFPGFTGGVSVAS